MDKIPPKTRVVYEFLHAYFDTALAKTTSARDEAMVSVLAKLDSKLDLLSGHMDDVKLSIGIDLDELHGDIGADCSTHVTPSSASVSPREPQLGVHPLLNGGPSESEGYKPNSEQRRAVCTPSSQRYDTELGQDRQEGLGPAGNQTGGELRREENGRQGLAAMAEVA
ncbi:hypothetical protein ZWY2020_042032 [Hordeum vulgare]|nr:hypothetical protein ZWY2020_042032 [Hordeum vulgare]